jgi:hypothetical protein
MRAFWYCTALLGSLLSFPAYAGNPVKVDIGWEYKDLDTRIKLYEVKGRPRLWETKSVKSLDLAPVGQEFKSGALQLEPGQTKRFALVMENKSDKPVFFFAAPHVVHPVEHSLGFKFKCLCINHAFTVGAGETWYRIVEFRLSRSFIGRELALTHSIIGIDQGRADFLAKESAQPDL